MTKRSEDKDEAEDVEATGEEEEEEDEEEEEEEEGGECVLSWTPKSFRPPLPMHGLELCWMFIIISKNWLRRKHNTQFFIYLVYNTIYLSIHRPKALGCNESDERWILMEELKERSMETFFNYLFSSTVAI